MRKIGLAMACLLALPGAGFAAEVKVETYAITGQTGLELYESIRRNAPNSGGHIAVTNFKLVWNRLFDERGGDCYLVHARPRLAITQTYPRPGKLPAEQRRRWDKLMGEVRAHEDKHVEMINEMVASTEASLQGMFERQDRSCAKIKKSVEVRIQEGYLTHRARKRAFDQVEFRQGAPLIRTLEDFVNDR